MRVRHLFVAAVTAASLLGVLSAPVGAEEQVTLDVPAPVLPPAATDDTAPTITITTPKANGSYAQNASLKAKFSCKDSGGSKLVTCTGTFSNGATIPTQTVGTRTFKVIASDGAGNITKKEVTYNIVDKTAPTVSISSPSDGEVFTKNEVVNADFDCDDNALGSGIDTCVGTVADGDPINTATLGSKTFRVTATDLAGNKKTKTVRYRVVNP